MGNQSANITFVPPANSGGLPIVEYVAMAFINGAPTGIFQVGSGSPIEVTGLTNGQPYTFEVYAVNGVGVGPWSAPSNVFTPAPTVPSPPLAPAASPGNGSATITFSPPQTNGGDPVTGYTATDASGLYTGSVSGYGPITVSGLTNGTGYAFTVVATNAVGNSLPSASVAVTPSGTATVPTAPLSPSAVAGNAQATVTFLPPASNGGAAITGYTVTSSPGALTGTGTASPIVVGSLTNGQPYTFTVAATNSVGTGPPSVATAPVTPTSGVTVPGPPTAVIGTPGNAQVSVAFTAPASNGGATITSYTVLSNPPTTPVYGAASPIVVGSLTNGQPYTFTVAATNSAGTGPYSAPSVAVTPATVPGTPEMIAATPGNQSAQVTFLPPTSNGGSPITSYTAASTPGNIMGYSSASPINVTGLTNGQSYTFNVLATNIIGNGAYNGPSNSVIPSSVPGPPTNLIATPGNQSVSVAFTAPVNTGGLTLGNYTVSTVAPGPTGFTATGPASPLTVSGLQNAVGYYFSAVASNADGMSAPSASIGPIVPATVPTAPQNVVATPGDGQITVTFTAPASNGGSPITSYTATSHPGSITASNGTNLTIIVAGLTNGTGYVISVAATNAIGTGLSANSAEVTPEPGSGFVIETTELASGQVGVAYPGSTVVAGGGASVPPYAYFNPGPLLPNGLSINQVTGAISGTPTVAGTFNPGFQATDSSGTVSFPTSTTVALNQSYNGQPSDQQPGGIQTTSSVPLVHGQLWMGLTTVATYGGAHSPPGLQTTGGDAITLQTFIAGPQSPYINASQETSLFSCPSAVGGTTTFQQWYGPDGFGGNNPGDQDYQAFLAFQYNGTLVGIGAFTAQTGTNYGGVAQGTALESGPITLSGSQVPCTIYGFCENTSQAGTNYLPSPNPIVTGSGNGYDGVIRVQGSQLVNGAGQVVTLRFSNMSGLENSCAQGNAPWSDDDGVPQWTIYKTWNPNAVRIPLCEASWLGLTTYNTTGPQGSPTWGTSINTDPDGNYRQAVIDAVAAAQSIGCYPILDLHWVNPNFTFGGVTHPISANGQAPFANADHSIAFWTSIANTFGTQATPQVGSSGIGAGFTISNFGILFELFNEPYLDSNGGTLSAANYNLAMRNGGTCSQWNANYSQPNPNPPYNDINFTIVQTWNIAGYQAMTNAVRGTGAANPLICNGGSYAQELMNYATYLPTDTLSPPQLICGRHPYPAGSNTPSTESTYAKTGNDPGGGTAQCEQWAIAVVAAGIPVLITEDGGCFGFGQSTEPHMTFMINATLNNGYAGYGWWQWNGTTTATNEGQGQFYGTVGTYTSPTPSQGEGTVAYNFMTTQPDSVPTIAPTTILNTWNFNGTQTNTSCYASWNITLPGTYTPSFNQNSSSLNCSQTVGWAVQAPSSGNLETALAKIPIVITASGGAPSPISELYLLYQGGTAWQQNEPLQVGSPYTISNPNTNVLGWRPAAGAATYIIQRASNESGPWTTLAAGLSGSGLITYTDNTATCSVDAVLGGGGGGCPTSSTVNFPANNWFYQVISVGAGGAQSAPSVTQSAYIYLGTADGAYGQGANGYLLWSDNSLAPATSTVNNDTTAGGAAYNGQTYDCLVTQGAGYWLPAVYGPYVRWLLWGGAFAYLNFDFKQINGANPVQLNLSWHCVANQGGGDENLTINLLIGNGQNTQYIVGGSLTVGQWASISIPVSAILKDSSGVLQPALYKITFQWDGGATNGQAAFSKARYSPNPGP